MDEASITQYITTTFASVETQSAMGYLFFFYDGDHMLPFATLALQDNEGDRASNLDRPGIYRQFSLELPKPGCKVEFF